MRRLDRRALGALSVGHACADLCQGAVPALLPFLAAARGWSFAALGSLVLAATIGSSLLQPLFGLAADRMAREWLPAAGVLIGGIGVAVAGLVTSYPATVAAIAVSGLGVAAFHPDAARMAGIASGDERGRGMSLFSVGGNAGFALGPVIVTPLVLVFGLHGAVGVLVPVAVALVVLRATAPRFARLRAGDAAARAGAAGAADPARGDDLGAFVRLGGVIGLRSGVFFGLQAFVPAYFVTALGSSEGVANAALTAMLVAGALGTLVGGVITDRAGPRVVVLGSLTLLVPLLVALPLAGTAVAVALLAAIGLCVIASFSTTVVLGQSYLPSRPGLASGVTLGLAIGLGGVAAAALGPLADAAGPEAVLWLLAVLPVPALALGLRLPDVVTRRPALRARSAAVRP